MSKFTNGEVRVRQSARRGREMVYCNRALAESILTGGQRQDPVPALVEALCGLSAEPLNPAAR